ncbi:hypothetical protein THUN1379_22070 [Paludibacterium sp. THUN1379]|uniref:bifunctional helix-turn-helix transcriptional regulator/GNAT family N-acetyltransferase n=1 Tax=Paludibacterium sp. THUN1379 TaxID=3112107 RepID=UPI00308A70C2|nr:hypothetical protein THUN1379_22070 [Paludibacterium sp. THUN1379]
MQPSIGNLLRELTRLYNQAQREHVTSGHDTSSTQSHVLMELGQAGLLTQQELGRRLSLDKGWVSRAVESLVQAELVAKSRHDNDRRSRWLELTAKGRKRYQALNVSLDSHAEQWMQTLDAAQREQIRKALAMLIAGMQGNEQPEAAAAALAAAPVSATSAASEEPMPAGTTETAQEAAAPVGEEAMAEPVKAVEATAATIADEQPEVVTEAVAETVAVEVETVTAASAVEAPVAKAETPAATRPHSPLADKVRPPVPVAHTRIVGSKTLPTRPLLSRTTPRTPLSRAAQKGEDRQQEALDAQSRAPVTPPSEPVVRPTISSTRAVPPAATTNPRTPVTPVSIQPAQRATASRPAAPVTPAMPQSMAGEPQRTGSLFQKLLSQGSLFNKLLQREQMQEAEVEEQPAPAEVEPEDGILFQAASPTDWNEIRNLLTANRLPVQGALNHLMNFVVATENGRVIGAIGMEVYGDIGLIRSLVVSSHMRGKSVAKRLLRALIERARAKQIGALYLLSGPTDGLFFAHGFDKMARADMPTKLYVSSELQGASSSSTTALRLIL